MNQTVKIDNEGVNFGGNYWVSHEAITGCVAALIPRKHPQYWKWVLQAKSPDKQESDDATNAAYHIYEKWYK